MESNKSAKSPNIEKVQGREETAHLALVRANIYALPPVKQGFFSAVIAEVVASRWLFLCAALIGLAAGFAYTLVQTPLFESHASIEVQGEAQDSSQNEKRTGGGGSSRREESGSTLETQVRILQSRSMLERALNHLSDSQRQRLVVQSRLGGSKPDLLDNVEKRLTVALSLQAHIIDLSFLSPDAQAGADFLNLLAQELSDYGLERQWKAAQRSGDWLQPQLNEVRGKLEQSENALGDYARGGGLAVITDGSDRETQWASARTDRIAKELFYERLRAAPPNKAAEASGDATLKDLQRQSDDLQNQMSASAAGAKTGADSQPGALKSQWRELQQSLEFRQTTVLDQAKGEYLAALRQEKDLRAQLPAKRAAALEASARIAPEKTARYALLKQDAEANRQLYESLTTRITEAGIANSLKTRNILLLDSAYAARKPVSPNLLLDVAAGLAAGMLASIVFVLFRRLASPTFSQPGTLSRVLSLPELGAVPEPEPRTMTAAALAQQSKNGIIPFSTNDDSAQSESYRAIRSSLLFQSGENLLRCLVFTSATAGEGKTTVASNLSMSLAATNRRVLIIDGDMRRPKLHKHFGVAPSPGLSDLLRRERLLGNGDIQYIVETAIPNLYLLPCGTAGGDAPELLAGDRLPLLLRDLRKSFDLVMIDTPPLLPCADARSFAKAADGVVLVVRANETDRREAGVARDTLLRDGSQVIGTVLTGFHARRGAYGYQGYSTTV